MRFRVYLKPGNHNAHVDLEQAIIADIIKVEHGMVMFYNRSHSGYAEPTFEIGFSSESIECILSEGF